MGKTDKVSGTEIAYQNKDISSKSFAERLKGRSLEICGLSDILIRDVLPTNLPAIEANELRLDNLFELADGGYAIIDYESSYSEANKVKYISYIARVAKRLYNEYGEFRKVRIIVIYTADVKRGSTDPILDMGGMSLRIEEGFLIDLDSENIRKKLISKLEKHEAFTEEDMMRLAIYPLTYKGKRAKQRAVREAIDMAERIEDERMQIDTMIGIVVFSDKVMAEDDARRVKRRLKMTKIERMYAEEREEAVRLAENKANQEKKDIAINFLKAGDTIDKVIQCTGLSRRTVQALASKI